jgi:hypothetical protein
MMSLNTQGMFAQPIAREGMLGGMSLLSTPINIAMLEQGLR